jgi:hypothetical protein
MEADHYCEAVVESNELPIVVRERVIEAGPEYRLIWIARGTVVGLDSDGLLLTRTSDEYLQDDRDKLLEIAKLAHLWYGRSRVPFQLMTKTLTNELDVGTYIYDVTNGSEDPVYSYTVVTEIEIQNPRAENSLTMPATMVFKTDFSELDVLNA